MEPLEIKIFDNPKFKINHSDKSTYYIKTDEFQITPLLKELYSTRKTETMSGNFINLQSEIRPLLGYVLYRIILDNNLSNVLEIGTGYGVSSLYMLEGLSQNKSLVKNFTTIDPNQNFVYKNINAGSWSGGGLKNIHKSGHSDLVNFIEEPSYLALPKLLEENKIYDLVFFHGMILFDYMTNDLLLIDQMTHVGSIIILIQNITATSQLNEYIKTNYKHWNYIKNSFVDNSYARIYVKMDNDKRVWNFDVDFDY